MIFLESPAKNEYL
uniref:Uncharacterized protein n=1 Tax=Rhizophora mucronata TaxID=61149 RepID=A0A2P2P0U1_RHIMU